MARQFNEQTLKGFNEAIGQAVVTLYIPTHIGIEGGTAMSAELHNMFVNRAMRLFIAAFGGGMIDNSTVFYTDDSDVVHCEHVTKVSAFMRTDKQKDNDEAFKKIQRYADFIKEFAEVPSVLLTIGNLNSYGI